MSKPRGLIHGFGVNDAEYTVKVQEPLDERRPCGLKRVRLVWKCPYYAAWEGMMKRCYSTRYLAKSPSYAGCYVCASWKYFSNFRAWMVDQDWEGNQLDKDYIVEGNRLYSPYTCVFISGALNKFITDAKATRGEFLIGCSLNTKSGKFNSACCNPFKKYGDERGVHLGTFDTELCAHNAWRERKLQYAKELIEKGFVPDSRVAAKLLTMYEGEYHE